MAEKTNLYRHYDAAGVLLYVGISLSAIYRLGQHMQASKWSKFIARVEIETFSSREAALRAEKTAIINESPIFNVVHNRARGDYRGVEPIIFRPDNEPYRPPIEDGDAWLTAVQVSVLLGGNRYHDRGKIKPALQRVVYLSDGTPRGNIYYWRRSDVEREKKSHERTKEIEILATKRAKGRSSPNAGRSARINLDETLFTREELARFRAAAA